MAVVSKCCCTDHCIALPHLHLNPNHSSPSASLFTPYFGIFFLPVPVANKRDTRSIEEAMNEIRAKKRQKQEDDSGAHSSSS